MAKRCGGEVYALVSKVGGEFASSDQCRLSCTSLFGISTRVFLGEGTRTMSTREAKASGMVIAYRPSFLRPVPQTLPEQNPPFEIAPHFLWGKESFHCALFLMRKLNDYKRLTFSPLLSLIPSSTWFFSAQRTSVSGGPSFRPTALAAGMSDDETSYGGGEGRTRRARRKNAKYYNTN